MHECDELSRLHVLFYKNYREEYREDYFVYSAEI